MSDVTELLKETNALLRNLSNNLISKPTNPDWHYDAFRWRHCNTGSYLQAVTQPHRVELAELLCIEKQKNDVLRNTQHFMQGKQANNVLLWGARGTGKSTLIKAIFNEFIDKGLRLIEVEKEHLTDLADIIEILYDRPEKFILFCDDLSFESDDAGYKALKSVLEGAISTPPNNVLIYASSNRRHLLPELQKDNQDVHIVDGEIHPSDAIEEKNSLAERFGLWLSFYPYTQQQYLSIVEHWLNVFNAGSVENNTIRLEAIAWASQRGSRSGRVAKQFAIDQSTKQA